MVTRSDGRGAPIIGCAVALGAALLLAALLCAALWPASAGAAARPALPPCTAEQARTGVTLTEGTLRAPDGRSWACTVTTARPAATRPAPHKVRGKARQ